MLESTITYADDIATMIDNMNRCYQFEKVTMYQHGLMVHDHYVQLVHTLSKGIPNDIIPTALVEWYQRNQYRLLDHYDLMKYHIFHDCGKPLCRTVDDNGKQHFHDHALVSFQQYRRIFPNDIDVAQLIKHDMDFHSCPKSDLTMLAKGKYGVSLYLTAWAEILANCTMFGGTDSISFKIKRKKLLSCITLFS